MGILAGLVLAGATHQACMVTYVTVTDAEVHDVPGATERTTSTGPVKGSLFGMLTGCRLRIRPYTEHVHRTTDPETKPELADVEEHKGGYEPGELDGTRLPRDPGRWR